MHVPLLILSYLCAALISSAVAQQHKNEPISLSRSEREAGIPYGVHFSPRDYRGDPQNWALIQRENGVMVIANGNGILTFDGAVWQTTPISNGNLVRCLAKGSGEIIYVGGYNEIGYIDYQQRSPKYVSLIPQLPNNKRGFGHTWNVAVFDHEVYFSTDIGLFRWDGKTFDEIRSTEEAVRAFLSINNDKLFVQANSEPLSVVNNNRLEIVLGGEFYRGKRITVMLPFDNDRLLIGTLSDGLFLYDGRSSSPFAPETLDFLRTNRLYKGLRLGNGNMAFATLQRGVIVLDPSGNVVQSFQKGTGIADDAVYNLFEDREGALWAAMSVGLSRIELQSPITLFNEHSGLEGAVNDIARYQGQLYVATMAGLFRLDAPAAGRPHPKFGRVSGIQSSVWGLRVAQGSLLIAGDDGTMEFKNHRLSVLDRESGAVMMISKQDKTVAFIGLADGVDVVRFQHGQWKSLGRIEGLIADIGEINEDDSGNIWLGTFSEGAIRLRFSGNSDQQLLKPEITRFGATHGLPVGYLQISRIGNRLSFRPEPNHTLYEYNSELNRFQPMLPSDIIAGYDSTNQYPLANDAEDKLWMTSKTDTRGTLELLRLKKESRGYSTRTISLARVREDFDEVIYEEDNGVVWMGGLDGVLRYDTRQQLPERPAISTVFNDIAISDSTIHCGMGIAAQGLSYPYAMNSIVFNYAATSFDLSSENEYQYLLEGFDNEWSSWSTHNTKSYTQIPEGEYSFKVRSRNAFGVESPESSFSFTIRPPWYRHGIAYGIYVLGFAGIIYIVVWMRSRKLERDKVQLMKIIEERTLEVSTKNAQLEQQAEELKTQTEQLREVDKLKTAFFSNISHEFRTPLSLIIAPLEKEIAEGNASSETQIMHRNARRLQRLINQLLDLSRIESQQMKVKRSVNNLTGFVRSLAQSFNPLAESRSIEFVTNIPSSNLEKCFDSEKLETVLFNLLSNAFKFTHEQGRVILSLEISESGNQCVFHVSDDGIGIAQNDQTKVFDRFYQVENGSQRSFEGSGIGLALTRELVELMGGKISLTSKPGRGSSFTVTLPITTDDDALTIDEIVSDFGPATDITSTRESFSDANSNAENLLTVLLVEDNPDLNDYLKGILSTTYRVVTTYDGVAALQAAKDEIPDLILSDMMMPRMDGFTLCEKIRADEATCHIPFVLLTARANIENRLAGLELGADDYITKPFVVAELTARIKNILAQRQLLKDKFRQELTIAPKNITVTSADEAFIRKVMEVTEDNLKDPSFSVERLSEEVGISRKHLHRKLVALAGQTPNEFIRIFRLKTAMQLLQQRSGTVKEVAFAVGFNNLSYFAKCFREEFAVSPGEVSVAEFSDLSECPIN